MDVADFVAKWRKASLQNEMQVYTDHLDDLCRLANHPTRLEFDPGGERFAVQKAVTKLGGTTGAADAWFRGHFAIEYKRKGGDLDAAYRQLLEYRDNLENPPLLIVCDLDRIIIRTNYTGRTTRKMELSLDNFASGDKVGDTGLTAIEIIRKCFHRPLDLMPEETTAKLTEKVADKFKVVADGLKSARSSRFDESTREYPRIYEDMAIAKFLNRMVFCMFASDIGLLPQNIVRTIIDNSRSTARATAEQFAELFHAMAVGGHYGPYQIRHFNGGLFSDTDVIEVDSFSLAELHAADSENWADVEPSIFGTLFERVIDEKQRKALGKHYTSREDIELLIHPVIMWPLLREWGGEDAIDQPFDAPPTGGLRREVEDSLSFNPYDPNRQATCHAKLQAFIDRLGNATILDPACGSGNFLYVALEKLVALEHEVVKLGLAWALPKLERKVHPRQLFGIEKNEYAHQLAGTVVWIGYLQSKRSRGDYDVDDPVLEPLDNIENKDAILDLSDPANPKEPEWPGAEFIVGNPPFLLGRFLRRELDNAYVESLFRVWGDRVPGSADLCCYWIEKSRRAIEIGVSSRGGLVATQGIRGGPSPRSLQRVKESGDIFFAVDDREWAHDAPPAVHVSMVGFDSGDEKRRLLLEHFATVEERPSGRPIRRKIEFRARPGLPINSDLTVEADVTKAPRLPENLGIAFQGVTVYGDFDVPSGIARQMLTASGNPNGRSNRDVMFPFLNSDDLTDRPRDCWAILFPPGTSESEAAQFQKPFEWLLNKVKPFRLSRNSADVRTFPWWLPWRPRPEMFAALDGLSRFLCVSRSSKHASFAWVAPPNVPSDAIVVFARSDDYFAGVLQSRPHDVWSRRKGTQVREAESGFRYSHTMTFETFPMPWPPGNEPVDDPLVQAIAEAARELNELKERALNPEPPPDPDELKTLTLTNLYNRMKDGDLPWLANAHEKLDRAVFAAYRWPYPAGDQEILTRLLEENLRRANL